MRKIDFESWTYKQFEKFINSPNSDESIFIELRENIEGKIKKDFAAFANTEGGYIIVGIEDKRKRIIGIKEDNQIKTRIADKLSYSNINPSIKWDIIKNFKIPRIENRMVFIIKVFESKKFKKPHICDGIIYFREEGKSEQVKFRSHLFELFFNNKFYPNDIDILKYELKFIKQYNYKKSHINFLFLKSLEEYLHDLKEANPRNIKIILLWVTFKKTYTIIDEIEYFERKEKSYESSPSENNSLDLENNYKELIQLVDSFIELFEEIHYE